MIIAIVEPPVGRRAFRDAPSRLDRSEILFTAKRKVLLSTIALPALIRQQVHLVGFRHQAPARPIFELFAVGGEAWIVGTVEVDRVEAARISFKPTPRSSNFYIDARRSKPS